MRSTHRAVSRGTSRRRRLIWATIDTTVPMAQGARNNVDLLGEIEVAGTTGVGITVMRTHVRMTFSGDAATGGLSYGLLVGRKLDVGPGVGPDPLADLGLKWAWLDRFFPTTTGGQVITASENIVIDDRAKRIVEEVDERWLLCLHNTNTAVATTQVRVFARTLVALP